MVSLANSSKRSADQALYRPCKYLDVGFREDISMRQTPCFRLMQIRMIIPGHKPSPSSVYLVMILEVALIIL